MTTSEKKILLWNPISNHGHLNMYLEIYASALLSLGYAVYYYADLDETFQEYLQEELPNCKSVEDLTKKRIIKRWSAEWILLVCYNKFKYSYVRAGIGLQKITRSLMPRKNQTKLLVDFEILVRKLRILKEFGFKPDLVICMYLDMTHLGSRTRKKLSKLSIPWIGLLFHPKPLSQDGKFTKDSWFLDASNRGGVFFTDNLLDAYNQVSKPNQFFELMPDSTRTFSLGKRSLILDLKKKAGARKIIGLIGALDGTKKLIKEFIEISKDPRLSNYYFVIAGEVYEATIEDVTVREILRDNGSVSDNLYIYNKYIELEADFDYLISQIDILYACYKDFDSSANILAKSARFEIPLLVTEGTWIGRITKQYGLGIAINNPGVSSLVPAILELGQEVDRDEQVFGFDVYRENISLNKLQHALAQYLHRLWEGENTA